jgi:hypothetical protein
LRTSTLPDLMCDVLPSSHLMVYAGTCCIALHVAGRAVGEGVAEVATGVATVASTAVVMVAMARYVRMVCLPRCSVFVLRMERTPCVGMAKPSACVCM